MSRNIRQPGKKPEVDEHVRESCCHPPCKWLEYDGISFKLHPRQSSAITYATKLTRLGQDVGSIRRVNVTYQKCQYI